MFDVIDDKPEGVARGVYQVSTRARRARVYTLSHQSWAGLCVINPRAILHEGFIVIKSLCVHELSFYYIIFHELCIMALL